MSNLANGNLVGTIAAEMQGVVIGPNSGTGMVGGYSPVPNPAQIVAAAQSAWFVSFANGSDANPGTTSAAALKTLGEWFNRTKGLVPTVANVTLTILDLDPANPPTLQIGYAEIGKGQLLTIEGTPAVVITTTVGAFQAENAATNTPRAITQAAVAWPAAPGAERGRMLTGVAAGTTFWPVAQGGAGQGIISAPYNTAGVTADPGVGDQFEIYTCPVVRDVQFLGIIDGDTSTPGNILIRDLEIGASGGEAAFTAPLWSGGGLMNYYACGILAFTQSTPIQSVFIACRHDGFTLQDGLTVQDGCVYDFALQFDDGEAFLKDGFASAVPAVVNNTTITLFGNWACFNIAGVVDGIFDIGEGAYLFDGGHVVYGTGNPFNFNVTDGGQYIFNAASPATNTRGDFSIDGLILAKTAMPYSDRQSLSTVRIANGITTGGLTGGAVGGKTLYGQVTADQAALAANVFTDIPGATTTVENEGSTDLDISFNVSGFASGAATGIQFRILIDAAVPLGGTGTGVSTVAGTECTCSFHVRSLVGVGPHTVRAQYNAGAGASLAIRPNTQSESCSVAVSPGVPG